MIDKYMCKGHGYAYLPNDPELYSVLNPPPVNQDNLCEECSYVMIQRGRDYPQMKDSKIWFNITSDKTQRELMLGRYVHLRFKGKDK